MKLNSTRQPIAEKLALVGHEGEDLIPIVCAPPPAPARPKISLICVNYNAAAWLPGFFASLERQTLFGQCEFLFVDNTSADDSHVLCEQFARRHPANCRAIATGGNTGFDGGCNYGAARARGDYYLFYNADVLLDADCLEQLWKQAANNPNRVLCGAQLQYDNDNPTAGEHDQGSPGFDIFGCPVAFHPGDNPKDLFAIGCFYFIHRSLFHKLGGFNESFFMYGEEMDLAWRAIVAGAYIENIPAARQHHASSGCTGKAPELKASRRYLANRNQLLMLLTNSSGPMVFLAFNYTMLMFAESVAGAIVTHDWNFFRQAALRPLTEVWRLRDDILRRRRALAKIRVRSDLQIIARYFKFRYGNGGRSIIYLKHYLAKLNPWIKQGHENHRTRYDAVYEVMYYGYTHETPITRFYRWLQICWSRTLAAGRAASARLTMALAGLNRHFRAPTPMISSKPSGYFVIPKEHAQTR